MSTDMYNSLNEILERKISIAHVRRILGESIYNGISNYLHEFQTETRINPEEILIDGLGTNILYNKQFQKILISEVLSESHIKIISQYLSIEFISNSNARIKILNKSNNLIGRTLIDSLNLDPLLYELSEDEFKRIEEDLIIVPDISRYLSLHDYQKGIKDEIVYNLLNQPDSKMLVHMPTGSGKTKTSIEAIIDFIRTKIPNEGLVLWFAHSTELCMQAYESLVDTWRLKGDFPLPVYRLFGDNPYDLSLLKQERAVIFIGFQKFNSILNSTKEDLIGIRSKIGSSTRLVIVDEAHKTLAKTYLHAINYVSSNVNCRVMGLTATPGRSNDVNDPNNVILSEYFGSNIISIRDNNGKRLSEPLSYLQDQNVLAKLEHKTIEINLDFLDPKELNKIILNGELDKTDINRLAESPHRNRIIIDEIEDSLNYEEKDLILVFACSVDHCLLLKKLLETRNIESEIILGSTPKMLRAGRIERFKKGELKVLINFGVLTTGFDAPKLKTLIIARHTNSMILYSQMIGRALRGPRNGGNKKNYVIDLVDNIRNMGDTNFMFSYWEDFWNKKLNFNN